MRTRSRPGWCHRGLPPGLSATDNETGWRKSLAKLAALVEAGQEPVRGTGPPLRTLDTRSEPSMDILDAIGNTSLVRLRKVAPPTGADILVKLEWENPTGSIKDRMADAVIGRAEDDGRLRAGDKVVEYTGGSTGTSLAFVCAVKGYRLRIVSSDAFSRDKLDHMAALGAELTLVRSEGGLTTRQLILDMIEAARTLSREPRTYWTDQLNNLDSIAGYSSLGEEIWRQTEGEIDAFVHCVGTGASLRGAAGALKRLKPSIRIVAVEPAESSVLLGGEPGPHKIEGVGIGYTPPLWQPALVDEILAVSTEDAKRMTRRIAREEGLFAGTSSGANVVAAIRTAERLGPGARVVTLMADSGLKYLSTDVHGRMPARRPTD
jgi:cysteine synthase A